MKTLPLLLLTVLGLALQPVRAQDGGDPEIEIGGCDSGCGDESEDETRKFGDPDDGPRDDVAAPKVNLVTQEKINKAIAAGVRWLKKRQDKDGSWGPVLGDVTYGTREKADNPERDVTGPTSFAVYTLAKCDVKKTDRTIKKGIEWLKDRTVVTQFSTGRKAGEEVRHEGKKVTVNKAITPYEAASIVLMIEAVHQRSAKLTGKHKKRKLYTEKATEPPRKSKIPEDDWVWMHHCLQWLTKTELKWGGGGRGRARSVSRTLKGTQNRDGGWRYGQANGDQDLSVTQFVLLALRAASQAGYPFDKEAPDTFKWAANYIKSCQRGDGGFLYQTKGNYEITAGMTACGIGGLLMAREQMALLEQSKLPWIDGAIERGMEHLDKVFDATRNPGAKPPHLAHHYYYLYAVERAGDLSGRKEFGGKDWYVRGARVLLAAQQPDGSWVDGSAFKPRDVLGTCYALLFLKRATPPVVTIRTDER